MLRYAFGDDASGSTITAMGYSAGGTRPTRSRSARSTPDWSAASAPSTRPTAAARALQPLGRRRAPLADGEFKLNAYAIRSKLNLFSNFTFFLDDPVDGDQFEQAERRTVVRPGGEPPLER